VPFSFQIRHTRKVWRFLFIMIFTTRPTRLCFIQHRMPDILQGANAMLRFALEADAQYVLPV
jgi:hypothetical protein